MRIRVPALALIFTLAGAAAPLSEVPPRAHPHHAIARIHAAAEKAIETEPLAGAARLPAPIGWMVTLAAFGLLGTLLRERRTDGRLDTATF